MYYSDSLFLHENDDLLRINDLKVTYSELKEEDSFSGTFIQYIEECTGKNGTLVYLCRLSDLYKCYELNLIGNILEWMNLYNSELVSKEEYLKFVDWWHDMRKSGVIERV